MITSFDILIQQVIIFTVPFLKAHNSPYIAIDGDDPHHLICVSKFKESIDFSLKMNVLAETVPNMVDIVGRLIIVKKSGLFLAMCISEENIEGIIQSSYITEVYKVTKNKNHAGVNDTIENNSRKLVVSALTKRKINTMNSLNPSVEVKFEEDNNTYIVRCSNKYPANERQDLRLIRITKDDKRIPIKIKPEGLSASFKDQGKSISVEYKYQFTTLPDFLYNRFECRTVDSYSLAYKFKRTDNILFPTRMDKNLTIQLFNKGVFKTSKQMKYFDVKAYPYEFYLECSVGLAYPLPEISWSDMEDRVVNNSIIFPSILNITQEYCCTVHQVIQFKDIISRNCIAIKFNQPPQPNHCKEVKLVFPNASSAVYTIYPRVNDLKLKMKVFCDFQYDNLAWIVIQRRYSGQLEFARNWSDYRDGFGNLKEEFWFGNEKLHQLSNNKPMTIRFDLWDKYNNHKFAQYEFFSVDSKNKNYKIYISGYHGNAGDSFNYKGDATNNTEFSTLDNDNDHNKENTCSKLFGGSGGFWFNNCGRVNLNGEYLSPGTNSRSGIIWYTFSNNWKSLKRTEIRIAFK